MKNKEQTLIIEAGSTEKLYWQDIWSHRDLFYFLSWRDILVRYKQTAIGIAWAIGRPILTMLIFTFIFGRLAKLPSEGVPYPVLVFTAMLPWHFFAGSLSECTNSLIDNEKLITKVYFPRMIVPASTVIVNAVDFLLSFAILVILMLFYKIVPDWRIVTLPLFLLMAAAASLGLGLWLSALNVKYRDFRYIVPFIIQLGIYISPVGFSSSIVPQNLRFVYYFNPMAGVIDGFRWALLGGSNTIYQAGFFCSLAVAIFFLISGIRYFRRTERSFADVI